MMSRLLLFAFMLLLAACAPAQSTSLPTNSPIPTFRYVAPTAPPSVATSAAAAQATAATGALDVEAVERGRERYLVLGCAECHGDNGDGDTPLTTSSLSETDFIALMRSGGALGAQHQYASNRLSASGGRNLYQYLLSLQEPS